MSRSRHARYGVLILALTAPFAVLAAGPGASAADQGVVADWAAFDQALGDAQHKLAAAEHALKQGRTPLPGERRGNVNGTSRLTPAYFDRVGALENAVAQAREQLDQTYAERRNLPPRDYQGPVQAPR